MIGYSADPFRMTANSSKQANKKKKIPRLRPWELTNLLTTNVIRDQLRQTATHAASS